MASKGAKASNQEADKKQNLAQRQVRNPSALDQQPTGFSMSSIIQGAKQDRRSLTPSNVLRLQQTLGNKVARKLVSAGYTDVVINKGEIIPRADITQYNQSTSMQQVVQRNPDDYTSNKLNEGKLTITATLGKITATGSFKAKDKSQEIKATLDFKVDKKNDKRIIIGVIKASPKRTGAGSILVYYLAQYAKKNGFKLIGTDLSALEEGTPEFYDSIGLVPEPEPEVAKVIGELFQESAKEIDPDRKKALQEGAMRAMYAGKLNGTVDKVLSKTEEKVSTSHWSPA